MDFSILKSFWDLEAGIATAKEFEKLLRPHKFHVALGGSVLHLGSSVKDLDLFIYPHSDSGPDDERLYNLLCSFGLTHLTELGGPYDRDIMQFNYKGKRIDFIPLH